MTGPDERAERAFREALRRHADDLDPAPVTVRGARRRLLLPVAAAVVVLAVVAGTAFAATRGGDEPPAAVGDDDPSATDATTALEPEVRQASWRGVEVDVPAGWGDAAPPGGDWCLFDQGPDKPPFPTTPYVARDTSLMVVRTIGCFEETGAPAAFTSVPPRYWAPHVSFANAEPGSTDSVETFRGWTLSSRTVDGVRVSVLADDATVDDAAQILGGARTVDTDANGCDSASPVQAERFVRPDPAFDVTALDTVDSVSVCRYLRGDGTTRPGLLGSRRITGGAATDLLHAIQAAPVGGGPDTPETCASDMYGDSAVVVRFTSADTAHDMYVYYDWCFGNGFDDGTTRRELTRESCLPLWGGRVQLDGGSSAPFQRCHE